MVHSGMYILRIICNFYVSAERASNAVTADFSDPEGTAMYYS